MSNEHSSLCVFTGRCYSHCADAAYFLHQHGLLVCGDMFMWAVPQQHIPLHACLHWRHPWLSRYCGDSEIFNRRWTGTALDLIRTSCPCRMCHVGPGDKCGDGGDGDAGSSWLGKCDQYLWKWGKCLILWRLTLLFPPRSFRLKAATVSRSAEWSSRAWDSSCSSVSCCSIECTEITSQVWFAECFSAAFWFSRPHWISICMPTGTSKRSAMVEEPATEQKRSAKTEEEEEGTSWEQWRLGSLFGCSTIWNHATICQRTLSVF